MIIYGFKSRYHMIMVLYCYYNVYFYFTFNKI